MSPGLVTLLMLASFGAQDDAERLELEESAFHHEGDDWRPLVHAAFQGGAIGVGRRLPKDWGVIVSAGVPLYLGTRWPHSQFVVDTYFSAAFGLATDRVLFVLTPTVGVNWYFLGWLGGELRGGIGLAARWTSQLAAGGLGYVVEASLVLRPTDDDHFRVKLGVVGQEVLLFSDAPAALSLAGGLGFELRI